MAINPKRLKVTELDFDNIKENLKVFLRSQDKFKDYDFEGSNVNVLIDLLAYASHIGAVNTNIAASEMFLDSAQIRGNVVTRAKLLGYTPRSVLSPRATVNITVTAPDSFSGTLENTLSLPRGTKLTTSISGEEFQYVVLSTQTASLVGRTYTFSN